LLWERANPQELGGAGRKTGLRKDSRDLDAILSFRDEDKVALRCRSEDLEHKLLEWGYVTAPVKRKVRGREEVLPPLYFYLLASTFS
jgi:hypothetical protein